jgi:hypothetical protein
VRAVEQAQQVAGATGGTARFGVHAAGTHTSGGLVGSAVRWKAPATREATSIGASRHRRLRAEPLATRLGDDVSRGIRTTPATINPTPKTLKVGDSGPLPEARRCAGCWPRRQHIGLPDRAAIDAILPSGSLRGSQPGSPQRSLLSGKVAILPHLLGCERPDPERGQGVAVDGGVLGVGGDAGVADPQSARRRGRPRWGATCPTESVWPGVVPVTGRSPGGARATASAAGHGVGAVAPGARWALP